MPSIVPAFAGAILAALWIRLDITGWLCFTFADAQGAVWMVKGRHCPGCGHRGYVFRFNADLMKGNDSGHRCLGCATWRPPEKEQAATRGERQ